MLGLPDKDYGEIVCAIIVPHEDAKRRAEQELRPAITLEELRNWAKERLAPYKVTFKNISFLFLNKIQFPAYQSYISVACFHPSSKVHNSLRGYNS